MTITNETWIGEKINSENARRCAEEESSSPPGPQGLIPTKLLAPS